MGADFMCTALPWCNPSRDRMIELVWAVEEKAFGEEPYFGGWFGYDAEDQDPQVCKEIMIAAIEAYWYLDARRDVSYLYLDDVWYLVTGGMSWGDVPTEAYEEFEKLEDLWPLLEKFAKKDREVMRKRLRDEDAERRFINRDMDESGEARV